MYQWVFFDWDGCIADSLASWVNICRQALLRQGIQASSWKIWEKFCIGDIPKQFDVKDYQLCKKDIGEIASEQLKDVELYKDAASTLRQLAHHKTLALITSTRPHLLAYPLRRHEIENCFRYIVTGESTNKPKPDPEGIIKTIDFLAASKDQSIMIGDSAKDLRAARLAGIDSVLFYPPSHHKLYDLAMLKTENPTYIVEDFKSLSTLLTKGYVSSNKNGV